MTGHVAKKGNRYYLVLETKDPATGKRKQKWLSTGLTRKRDAEERLHEVLTDYRRGDYVAPSRMTLKELLTRWLASDVKLGSAKKYRDYESICRCHLIPALGQRLVQELAPLEIQEYIGRALESGKIIRRKGGKIERGPLALESVRKHYAVLSAALNRAVDWGIIARSPTVGVSLPGSDDEDEGDLEAWSADECARFLRAASKVPNYPIYALALGTGLRQGELFGLKWDDVDFEAMTIRVRRTLRKPTTPPQFGPPKTQASRRTISISPALAKMLRSIRVSQKADKLRLGPEYEDYGLVFCQPNGRPMHPNNLAKREFVRLKATAGVPDISWHGMRHTHATELIRKGVHVKVISARLGHTSIRTTMDIYGHLLPDMQSDAAVAIDEHLPDVTSTELLPKLDSTRAN